MSKFPGMTIPTTVKGGKDPMIGNEGTPISLTILGDRLGTAIAKVSLSAWRLYARLTSSPYKARPFMENGVISSPTNTTNATADIPDADAVKFKNGDSTTFYDVSAAALAAVTLPINTVGVSGSGGAGLTLITFTGVWGTAPAASDLLCVADGSQLSANVVVVPEEIEFDGSSEFASVGYLSGTFKKSGIENTARFDQDKQQNIQLVDIQ